MERRILKISVFLGLALVFAPFLTWGQMASDSVFTPTACYNFVNDFENDNALTNCSEPGAIAGSCIEPLVAVNGQGEFVLDESLCFGNNQFYQMQPGQALDVPESSLPDSAYRFYTIEFLFRVDSIPPNNRDNAVYLYNFSNQSGQGSLIINGDGFLCLDFAKNNTTPICGDKKVSPNYPNDLPTAFLNIAFSFDGDFLTVYFDGDEQFSVAATGGQTDFEFKNNTDIFNIPDGYGTYPNPVAGVTIDYLRYFSDVLDATSLGALNLAAVGDDIEIIASDTVGCLGDVIQLTADGGAKDYYIWSTGDTTSSEILDFTLVNPIDTVWVKGVAISPCERRCFDVADTIIIYGNPLPEAIIIGPTELCEFEPATFSSAADPAEIVDYTWSTTGSTSSSSGNKTGQFNVTFDAPGTFDVTLLLENVYGCIKDTTIQVLVKNVPTITYTAPTTACEEEVVNIVYTGDAGATANFTWAFDGGVVVSENVPDKDFSVRWDVLGVKTITFEIEENNCLVSNSFTIDVAKRPTITLTAPDTVCAYTAIDIAYTGNASNTAVFDWVFSDVDAAFAGPDTLKTGTWTTNGTKQVILNLEEGGCVRSDTINVVVLPLPTSSLTAPTRICLGDLASIEYTGTASAAAQLVWNLGGGVRLNETSVDRIFDINWTTIGTKEITLSIDQDNCVKDTTFFIEVARTPTSDFNMPASACSDAAARVVYTGDADLTATSLTFDWNFDGGTATPVAGGQEAYDVVWPAEAIMPATKTVTLTVTENGCPSVITSNDIVINRTPIISFTPAIPASVCLNAPLTATFNGNAGSAGIFTWDFGVAPDEATNAGTNTNLDLSWTTPGTKTISLSIDNNGCITTETFTIEVIPVPTLTIDVAPTVCEGEYLRFTYTGTADVSTATFNWNFDNPDDVIALNDQSYDVKWQDFDEVTLANNTKSIELEIIQNGCVVVTNFTIDVLQKPNPVITSAGEVCVNNQIEITFQDPLNPTATYNITNSGGGVIVDNADPNIKSLSWSTAGTKNIEATFSLNGCDTTVSHSVIVFAQPSTNVQGPTEICDNEIANFEYVGNGGPFTSVDWSVAPNAGVTPTTATGTTYDIDFPVVTTPTVYTVTAIIQNGAAPNGCSQTVTRNVTVNPAPIAIIPDPGAVCSTESVVFDLSANFDPTHIYSWTWGGATVESNNGGGVWTVNWPTDGSKNISLIVRSTVGCVSTSNLVVNISPIPIIDFSMPANACTGTDQTIAINNYDPTYTYQLNWAAGDEPDANPDGVNGTNGVWDQLQWTSAPPNGGFKEANLSVSSPAGCTVDSTFIFQVNNFPEFTVSSANTCTGIPVLVEFVGAIEAGLTISWDFDGGIATQVPGTDNYNVYWNTVGILPPKTITASVTGSVCGNADFTIDVVVNQGSDPIYTETFGDAICITNTYEVVITDGGTGGPFNITSATTLPAGDGATISGFTAGAGPTQTISVDNWTVGGNKQLIVELQDAASLCPLRTDTLDFQVFNYSEITLNVNSTCVGGTIEAYFSGVIGGGATLDWAYEGVLGVDYNIISGTGTEADPHLIEVLTIPADGIWDITADISGGSCDPISATESITVAPPAVIALNNQPAEVCEGQTASFEYLLSNFSNSASPLNSIIIKFLDAPVSQSTTTDATATIYQAMWNTPGIKDYRLIVNNGGCIDSADFQITVNEIPVAAFTQSDNIICLGEQVNFTFIGTFPSADPLDIIWDFNGEASATGQNPSHIFTTIGSKTITLTVNNGACQDVFTRTILVEAIPEFTLNIPADICANVPFEVSVTNDGAGVLTDYNFNWNHGVAAVNPQGNETYELLYTTAGADNISVTITNNAGCAITLTQAITIDPAPTNSFAVETEVCVDESGSFQYTGVTTGAAIVNWDFGNGTATGIAVTNSWSTAGTKTVTVTVGDATTCILTESFEVEVIPNPTQDVTPITEACLNTSFLFEYLGDADPITDSFTWTFSDAANATVSKIAGRQAYNVSYATLGTKTITIDIVADGCPITVTHDVNIVPTPDFTVDLSTVCTGDTTTFYTGTSIVDNINPGSGGTWINNGGASVNQIVWTTAGDKNIALTLSAGNCSEVQNFTVTVNPTPGGVITPSNGCAGETIFVTYGGAGAASIFATYDWGTSFDAATRVKKVAGQEAYEVIWDTPGTYDLAVTVTEDGCSNTIALPTIEISEIPIADFDLQPTTCSLEELTINVTNPTVGYVYNWDLDAGGEMVSASADSSSITVIWQTPGDKTVTLLTTLGGCTVTTDEVIRVLEAANPAFDAPFFCFDDVTGEAIGTILYTGGSNLTTTTFDWDFDLDPSLGETATQIPGTENYDIVYKSPGFKVITLTVTNPQCGARTFVDSIAVNNLAQFIFDAENNALCQGATAVFTFTGSKEPGATLSWDFDLGAGDDSTEIVKDSIYEIVYNLPGLKTISLQINGVNCGSPIFTDTFNVGEAPTSTFRLGTAENCLGDTTSVTYTGNSTSGAIYSWDFADGVETAINDSTYTVIWPTPGAKDITLFIEDGGCFSDTTVQTINVFDNAALNLYSDNTLCIDSLGLVSIDTTFLETNATWNWTFNDDAQIISDLNNSTQIEFSYPTSGQKSIRLQVIGDKCEGFDTTVFVNVGELVPFDISADTEICSNDSSRIVFNLPIISGRSLTWDFGSGSSFTKISNTREDYYVKWDTAGVKTVNVSINNGGCIIDSSFQVNVTQLPDATFQMADFLCRNDTLYANPDWPLSPFTRLTWTYDYNGVIGTSNANEFALFMPDEGSLSLTLNVLENGCMDTYTTSAIVRPTPLAAIDAPELICLEGTAIVSFSETIETGATFEWSFGDADRVDNLGNETFELGWDVGGDKTIWVVTTLNGCPSDTAFHTLNVFSVDNLQFSNDTICQHQTVIVNFIEESVSDNIDSWDFGGGQVISGDINSLGPIELFYSEPGDYTVTLNLAGYVCGLGALSRDLHVDPSQIPSLSIEIPPLVCRNTDISLALSSTNGGDSAIYEYFINDISIGDEFDSTLLRDQDVIKVVMTSSAPCAIFPQATSNEVVANISDYKYNGDTYANPTPVCIGDPTTLSLDPGNYSIIDWESSNDLMDWESEGNNDPDYVTILDESKYFRAVIIDNSGVCTLTTPPVLAEVVPYNPIDAGEDRNIREGNSIILEATQGMNFIWKNDLSIETDVRNSRIQVKPLKTTIYVVEGLTLEGCPDIDSLTVTVRPVIAPPNVFSPNNDGVNDTWVIDQIDPYPNAEVAIYNRWGKKLFDSIGYKEPWGGVFNGEIVGPGVYYYVIDLKDGYKAVTGTVTVLY